MTVQGQQLVIYQGRPGGLLWFRPKLVDQTGVTTAQVLAVHLPALQGDVNEPTLGDAHHYVTSSTRSTSPSNRWPRGLP